MTTDTFVHLVEIDVEAKIVNIYRLGRDGQKTMYTTAPLPVAKDNLQQIHDDFAEELGEALIIDSPQMRQWFNI